MTKRLEEELGLPPIEEVKIPEEIEETLPTIEESQEEIAIVQGKLEMTERIDGSLPAVEGLQELIEVKPSAQMLGEARGPNQQAAAVVNAAKWEAARAWCKKQGLGFRVITEREIYNSPQKRRR